MQLRSFGKINPAIQQSFQFLAKSDHLQQGTAPLQIHQKVKVAAGPILATSHRAIDPEVACPMAVSHGKHLLSGGEEPLGEGGFLVRRGSHGPILDCIPAEGDGQYTLMGGECSSCLIPTTKRSGPKSQASKIQAAEQLIDGAAHLTGHVLEDLPQGANPQGLVGRNPHRASSSCLT